MLVAVDTETTLITAEEPIPQLVSVSAAGTFGTVLFAQHDPALPEFLRWLLTNATLTGANFPYDVLVILRRFPELLPLVLDAYEQSRVRDVITRDRLIVIARGESKRIRKYDLGAVAQRRAGIELDKDDPWRTRYGELLGVDIAQWPAAAKRYAINDAVGTLAADLGQEKYAHLLDNQYDTARAHLALFAASVVGLDTDQQQVDAVDLRLRTELGLAAHEIVKHGLGRWEFEIDRARVARHIERSFERQGERAPRTKAGKVSFAAASLRKCTARPVELFAKRQELTDKERQELVADGVGKWALKRDEKKARAMLESLGVDSQYTTEKGASLSEEALEAANIPGGHPLDAFRRYGATRALWTKNIPTFRAPVVRTRYTELVDTGRTSSSKPKLYPGTNLQNLAREGGFRECLVAPEGYVLVITDYGALELVTHAEILLCWFGWSKLADMLNAGIDPHTKRGMGYLGLPYESFDKSVKEHKDKRQLAKAENFGLPGGLGAKRFVVFARTSYGLELTEDEAVESKRRWLADLPEMQAYFDEIKRGRPGAVEIESWKINDYGREVPDRFTITSHTSGRRRAGCTFPEAANGFFQQLAADAAKEAGWRLFRASLDPRSPLHDPRPFPRPIYPFRGAPQTLFVHDEYVTTCREDRAEDVKAEQERIMLETLAKWCPRVKGKVESNIVRRYGK